MALAAAETLLRWHLDPVAFVREALGATPDAWQCDVLSAMVTNQRVAMASAKGCGKTTTLAWAVIWFMTTRPHAKVACVATSYDQLQDGLWSELSLWINASPIISSVFEWQRQRIVAKESPSTWWCSARAVSKGATQAEQAASLAGLHARNIMLAVDESGLMSDAFLANAEAVLSACDDGRLIQGGNTNSKAGMLWRACSTQRHLWHVSRVTGDPADPKRASRIDRKWAADQIAQFGRESPFVKVNIFAEFPDQDFTALISLEEATAATERVYRPEEVESAALVLGVDCARFGDDLSVVFPRRGLMAFEPLTFRNIDGTALAGIVARKHDDWTADAILLDSTGGYGSSLQDNLVRMGYAPLAIGFAERANDPNKYANRRAEMIFEAVEWIKRGGRIPNIPELISALSQTSYTFQGDRLLIEPKSDVKTKLGFSPDHLDALALTHAVPIRRKQIGAYAPAHASRFTSDYSPMAHAWAIAKDPGRNNTYRGIGGW